MAQDRSLQLRQAIVRGETGKIADLLREFATAEPTPEESEAVGEAIQWAYSNAMTAAAVPWAQHYLERFPDGSARPIGLQILLDRAMKAEDLAAASATMRRILQAPEAESSPKVLRAYLLWSEKKLELSERAAAVARWLSVEKNPAVRAELAEWLFWILVATRPESWDSLPPVWQEYGRAVRGVSVDGSDASDVSALALPQEAKDLHESIRSYLRRGERGGRESEQTLLVALPFSGDAQAIGERVLRMLLSKVNPWDVPGLRVLIADTGTSPIQAVSAVRERHSASAPRLMFGPIAARAAHLMANNWPERTFPMSIITPTEGLLGKGLGVFRISLTPENQAREMVSYSVNKLGLTRFGLLYPVSPYGERYASAMWSAIEATTATLQIFEAYEPGSSDFTDALKHAAGYTRWPREMLQKDAALRADWQPVNDADALVIPSSPEAAQQIVPQLAYNGIEGMLVAGDFSWNNGKLAAEAVQGIEYSYFFDMYADILRGSRVEQFRTAAHLAGIANPDRLDAAVYLWANAITGALQPDVADAEEYLRGRSFPSLQGDFRFADDGDAEVKLYPLMISGGSVTMADPGFLKSVLARRRQRLIDRAETIRLRQEEEGEQKALEADEKKKPRR